MKYETKRDIEKAFDDLVFVGKGTTIMLLILATALCIAGGLFFYVGLWFGWVIVQR